MVAAKELQIFLSSMGHQKLFWYLHLTTSSKGNDNPLLNFHHCNQIDFAATAVMLAEMYALFES
jgi:hypothetical protein